MKSLTISNRNIIALKDSKNYHPIGIFYNIDGILCGKIKKDINSFVTKLDETNSISFKCNTKSEVRVFCKDYLKQNFPNICIK